MCKELTIKHGLYFAGGKENVKRHRLREPDKAKYEIYDALKSAVPRANSWQELAAILAKEGITIEFKTKVGGKWKSCILMELMGGAKRPSELHRRFNDASPRVIDQQLKELEVHGMISKKIFAELPPTF